MALFSFGRRRADDTAPQRARVTTVARMALELHPEDAVTVSEIDCGDPDCGGAETVILVMRAGRRTEAVKVKKSLALVTDAEVIAALTSLAR